jgi:Fic family protein
LPHELRRIYLNLAVKIINRSLDGFEGKLASSKWAAIATSSKDTALRDINALVELGSLSGS